MWVYTGLQGTAILRQVSSFCEFPRKTSLNEKTKNRPFLGCEKTKLAVSERQRIIGGVAQQAFIADALRGDDADTRTLQGRPAFGILRHRSETGEAAIFALLCII